MSHPSWIRPSVRVSRSLTASACVLSTILCSSVRAQEKVIPGLGVEDFGAALLIADLDLDDKQDVIIGAPHATVGARHGVGRIVIARSGKSGVLDKTGIWIGAATSNEFGRSLASGDLDGDGVPELAVGAPGSERGKGAVYILRGGKGGGENTTSGDLSQAAAFFCLKGSSPGAQFGGAIAIADLDGDGRAELIVSEPMFVSEKNANAGRVLVFRGRKSWKGASAVSGEGEFKPGLVLIGQPGDGLGQKLLIGEFNADGLGDLVIATSFAQRAGVRESGLVLVIAGRADLLQGQVLTVDGEGIDWTIQGAGRSRAGASIGTFDFAGDGSRRLLVGAPALDASAGRRAGGLFAVTLTAEKKKIDLADPAETGLSCLRGQVSEEGFAESFARVAGDPSGRAGIVIGSPSITRVIFLKAPTALDPAPDPERAFMPSGAGIRSFGTTVGAGDVNGDGKIDIVVGAPADNKVLVYH